MKEKKFSAGQFDLTDIVSTESQEEVKTELKEEKEVVTTPEVEVTTEEKIVVTTPSFEIKKKEEKKVKGFYLEPEVIKGIDKVAKKMGTKGAQSEFVNQVLKDVLKGMDIIK